MRRLAAAAAGLLLVALAGCGASNAVRVGGGLLPTPQPAPTLAGRDLDTSQMITDLHAAYPGKTLVVNFYASWCAPCRAETPLLVQVAAANSPHRVQFVGVLFRDSPQNGRAFRQAYHVTYPSLIDPEGTLLARFRNVNPSAIPDTFIIDRTGAVRAKWSGAITDQQSFAAVLRQVDNSPQITKSAS